MPLNSVEDSSGKVTKEQLTLQVGGENAVPTCALLSPDNQSSFEEGDSILFEATALIRIQMLLIDCHIFI